MTQSACETWLASMRAKISGSWAASSGKFRWQWESTYMMDTGVAGATRMIKKGRAYGLKPHQQAKRGN
ncbi:hypothetical protein [Orrella dioscoreae]|uniref:hypothetical protein n=1 Tax=Orrella dioscoreae TaxID=1851544 RepID=UPI0038CDA886